MGRIPAFLFALAAFLAAGDACLAGGIRDVSPEEAFEALKAGQGKPGFVVLDVRTPREFAEERIEGAVNLDFHSPAFRAELAKLDRGKSYWLYCRTGNRSGKALQVMRELGFQDVIHLAAGIVGWKEKGCPTVRGR